MPVESADDRAAFFNDDEFGVAATYTPNGGAASAVTGIFDQPTFMEALGERAMTQDTRTTFVCQEDDLPAAAAADSDDVLALTHPVSGEVLSFIVATIEPDGQGMALLSLRRSA